MGERFGDYEIEGRLGAGGMAEVYVARRAGPEGFVKRVCLKRVLAGSETDREAVAQFHDEARLCAHLHHPAIAGVHELGQVDGKWFMAMELVDGMDLRSLVQSLRQRGGTLPHDVAIHVVRMVAEALAYAHALTLDGRPMGLVHRDVTPSNVLLSIHGEVKLADFGIARSAVRTHRTRSGVVKGKVPYMAPEQALGDALDRRTDLFALGVVLFELLAGRRPHDGQTDLDTLTNAQRGRRPSLRELAPDAPAEVAALVNKMLAARPEDRVSTADEVARTLGAIGTSRDLRRALAELVDEARRAKAGPPPTRVRGPRVRVAVDGAAAAGTPTTPDDGPTEVGASLVEPASEARSESLVVRRPPPPRAMQFAVGFLAVMGVGGVLLLGIVLALGGQQITRAIAEARSEPTASASEAAAPVDPPKPAPDALPAAPPVTPPPAPAPEVPVADPPVRSARHAHHRTPRSTTSSETSSVGHLQIIAVPFGDVSVDGHALGRAPQTLAIEAGSHRIAVTNGSAHEERRVTVEPGATQRVVFDLLE